MRVQNTVKYVRAVYLKIVNRNVKQEQLSRNVITFGVDISSSAKIDNRKKDFLILGKDPTQGSENRLSEEKMYSINFTI